jgi:hypothetical protein
MFAVVALIKGVLILTSGPQSVNYPLLPFSNKVLAYVLIGLAVGGALILLAAVHCKAKTLYLGWSVLVLFIVIRYFFFSDYGFSEGSGEFTNSLYVVAAAAMAALGAKRNLTPNCR